MRIRGALIALCVVVPLVGCSDDPEPRTLPPVPSASPSPSVVPMPTVAAAETPEGAAAFARYWMAVLESALATGDSSQLRALSDPACGGCANLIGAVESGQPGETIRGANFVVEFAEAPPVGQGETVVTLRYRRTAGELVPPSGQPTPIAAEGPIDAEMRLSHMDSTWIVLGFRGTPA